MSRFVFKIATEPDEYRQIRALNYRTFVEEIPQHHPNSDHSLVDRFEGENTFCICRHGDEVVGMLALRSNRPFSLDRWFSNLEACLPPHRSPCEIRLLAVETSHRKNRILPGLIGMVYQFFEARGHDLALISGTLRQTHLYKHLGFVPFGPLIGSAEAPYQPMYQFIDGFRRRAGELDSPVLTDLTRRDVNLLPGPVYLTPAVQAALGATPVSHRAGAFDQLIGRTKRALCELTGAAAVTVAMGSGTLANDLVAGQLAQISGRGLVLSNGEFGQRLVDHASRFQLDFDTVEAAWGDSFIEDRVRQALAGGGAKAWLWAVHAETSTGVLNDADMLKRLSHEFRLTLCLDCVSSLGVVPCDLRGVCLASGVSGKGLRSISGLALVFHDEDLPPATRPLPRYLDLRLYLAPGVPFTMSSNLVAALGLSLEGLHPEARFNEVREAANWLRRELRQVGLAPLAAEAVQFPGAVTIPLPGRVNSYALGEALARRGWLLSYQSNYLIERNWVQVCLLGNTGRAELEPLPGILAAEMTA
jgi:aspartate aminotransferase-like enzyme